MDTRNNKTNVTRYQAVRGRDFQLAFSLIFEPKRVPNYCSTYMNPVDNGSSADSSRNAVSTVGSE